MIKNYKEFMEEKINPLLIEDKNVLDTYLIKYKSEVIDSIQTIINRDRYGRNIIDDSSSTFETKLSNIIYIDNLLFYFIQQHLEYQFFIKRDRNCLKELILLNNILTKSDYTNEVSNLIDIVSETLDYVSYNQRMLLDEQLRDLIIANKFSDEELDEIFSPEVVKIHQYIFHSSSSDIEQYMFSKLSIENKNILLDKFLNMYDISKKSHGTKEQVRGVLFNNNNLTNNSEDLKYVYNKQEHDCWWSFLISIVKRVNNVFEIHLQQFELLDCLYENIEIKEFKLEDKTPLSDKKLEYLNSEFSVYEIVEILIYSHLLKIKNNILKDEHKSKNYFLEQNNIYKNKIIKICNNNGLSYTEDEVNIFSYVLGIYLIGNVSLSTIRSRRSRRPRSPINVKNFIPFIVKEDLVDFKSLISIFNKLTENLIIEKKSPLEILGSTDKYLLDRYILQSIQNIGSKKTVSVLEQSEFPSYFWKEYKELSILDNLIPKNKNKDKLLKF